MATTVMGCPAKTFSSVSHLSLVKCGAPMIRGFYGTESTNIHKKSKCVTKLIVCVDAYAKGKKVIRQTNLHKTKASRLFKKRRSFWAIKCYFATHRSQASSDLCRTKQHLTVQEDSIFFPLNALSFLVGPLPFSKAGKICQMCIR